MNRLSRHGWRPASAVVVGAGVVGVSTAYALARRGMAVTLVEAAGEAGRGTSFANGAQLSYVYTDALASPGLLGRLPALALGTDEAFRLRLGLDPELIGWTLKFLGNCSASAFRANTLAALKLGLESRAALHALLDRHELDFGHAATGKIHLYDSVEGYAAALEVMAMKAAVGAVQRALTPAEAVAVEPALAARPDPFVGAIHSPQEEVGDPWRFANAMAAMLAAEYGVTPRFNTRAARIETGDAPAVLIDSGERISADEVVLCSGVETNALLRGTGIRVPVQPMKGYSFTAPTGPATPRASITDVSRKIVFCLLDGQVRVAGLAELGAWDRRVDPRRMATLVRSAQASLPGAMDVTKIGHEWAGLRPMTPDSLPIIARPRRGLALNTGHGQLGWTLAMGSAERLAARILETAEG